MEKSTEGLLYFIVATTVVIMLFVVTVISLLLTGRNRRLMYHNALLENEAEFIEKINLAKHEVMEQVFTDVSAELHDNVGQTLTLAVLKLNSLDDNIQDQIAETREIIRLAIKEMRDVAHTLNKDYWQQFNLDESLHILEGRLKRLRGLTFELTIDYQESKLGGGVAAMEKSHEILIFRCIQELINNSLKHSRANFISLNLTYENHQLKVCYIDNGVGLPSSIGDTARGLGLNAVKTRMNLCKATWEIKENHGTGFEFRANIPIIGA